MPTVNENQVSGIINALYQEVTGQAAPQGVNAGNFVSVFQSLLTYGTEKVFNTMAAQIIRRIYAARPYSGDFVTIYASNDAYGGIIDKVSFYDDGAVEDQGYSTALTNGQSVDMYTVRKPLITNARASGYTTIEDYYTKYFEQGNIAFKSMDDFARFWAAFATHLANKHTVWNESAARLLVANAATALKDNEANHPESCVKLITEYNTQNGTSLTYGDIFNSSNCEHFWRWVFTKYNTILKKMSSNTVLYHMQPTTRQDGKKVLRHTPKNMAHSIVLDEYMQFIKSNVLSVTFNPENLDLGNHETVSFWQAPNDASKIICQPTYIDETNGEQKTAQSNVTLNHVFGFIYDRDSMAITIKNQSILTTPINARGRYIDTWFNFQRMYTQDFSENMCVLLLE